MRLSKVLCYNEADNQPQSLILIACTSAVVFLNLAVRVVCIVYLYLYLQVLGFTSSESYMVQKNFHNLPCIERLLIEHDMISSEKKNPRIIIYMVRMNNFYISFGCIFYKDKHLFCVILSLSLPSHISNHIYFFDHKNSFDVS